MNPSARPPIPGWHLAGSHPHEYEHGLVDDRHDGDQVAFLRCIVDQPGGFGTVMQTIDATRYRGQRIRFSGAVATESTRWVGLWMRVDEQNGRFSAFDNMQGRPIDGTRDWQRYEVVLDVGDESCGVAFGILLAGAGEARFCGLHFEPVSRDVPTTGGELPVEPQNLDFGTR